MVGCPPEAQPLTGPPGVTAVRYGPGNKGAEVLFYTVADCGHTWPGGKSLLPERMVGKTTNRLNATDVIWTFFQQHPMR
jgi:polyhydroxybutyrate depolymerase